jgi:4-amino-4-deoxy-L-arabinose transferase-like glycosyltransferase
MASAGMSSATHETPGFTRPNGFDLLAVGFLYIGGLFFLWDARAWAPNVYIGHDQFGDADFWWQGVLEMSQGIFWDNLNFTFRMGYAIFGGLLVTLFGPDYATFHKLLISLFVAIASAVYIIGIPLVGRTMAFTLAAALVFSPFTAEWLAISTSDGLGLIFNLIALVALWYALSESIRYSALATAGIFIALAALTRPLMTVFAAPAALLIFLFAKGSFSVRVFQVIVFIIAIALPIVAVGCTILSQNRQCRPGAGHDASIFYAASDSKCSNLEWVNVLLYRAGGQRTAWRFKRYAASGR